MTSFLAGLSLGALAAYAAMRVRYAGKERELSLAMREVARLTAKLNQGIAETEQVFAGKARLN